MELPIIRPGQRAPWHLLAQENVNGEASVSFPGIFTPPFTHFKILMDNIEITQPGSGISLRAGSQGNYLVDDECYDYATTFLSPMSTSFHNDTGFSQKQIVLSGEFMNPASKYANSLEIDVSVNGNTFISFKWDGMLELVGESHTMMNYVSGAGNSEVNEADSIQILATPVTFRSCQPNAKTR